MDFKHLENAKRRNQEQSKNKLKKNANDLSSLFWPILDNVMKTLRQRLGNVEKTLGIVPKLAENVFSSFADHFWCPKFGRK